jgi:hypothetical protein
MTFNLAAAVAACPAGYYPGSGGRIQLPPGITEISDTIQIGDGTGSGCRNSITIEGVGSGVFAVVPRFSSGASTVKWTGPPGRPMFRINGSSWINFRDFVIDGLGAETAIEITANNSTGGAFTHLVDLERLTINGPTNAIVVTGAHYADQVDFVALRKLEIRDVDVGLRITNQQCALTRADHCEFATRRIGVQIDNGQFMADSCYFGQLPNGQAYDPAYIAIFASYGLVPTMPLEAHQHVRVYNSHFETHLGRVVVAQDSSYPVVLGANSFTLIPVTPGQVTRIVDGFAYCPVEMLGGNIIKAGGALARLMHEHPAYLHGSMIGVSP